MKKRIVIILIAVISIATLGLISYNYMIYRDQYRHDKTPTRDALPIYTNALSKIDESEDMLLSIHLTEEMTIDGTTFLEVTERKVYYDMQASSSPYIQIQEKRSSGTHDIDITEIYIDGTVYLTVNETPFKGNCDIQEYESYLVPAIIISPDKYRNIEATNVDNGYIITFSEPLSAESWLIDPLTPIIDARGVACVSNDGNLSSSLYTISYQQADVTFRVTAEVSIEQKSISITPPGNDPDYTPIANWQAPKYLERACGYLLQVKQISALYNDSIYFEAIGDRREKRVTLHAYFDTEWSVSVETDIFTKSETMLNQVETNNKHETYIDGQYQVSNNGEDPVLNETISVDNVYNYFRDQLVSTVMLPQHIEFAEIVENDNMLRIIFTGTDTFGYFLAENACQLLYNDPHLITESSVGFVTNKLNGYLDINMTTGLPLASGIDFEGRYTVEGLPYSITYSADQTYIIPDRNSIKSTEKAADN